MHPFGPPPVFRIGIPPKGGGKPRGHPKEAHPPPVVAEVRALVETTILTYRDIAAKTGIDSGTISRWATAQGWTRPPGAWRPRPKREAPPAPPTGRALARGLYLQAERLLVEVTGAPKVDPAALREALQLLKDAREAQRVFRGARRTPPSPETAAARKARRNARLKAKRDATRAERAAAREERRLLGGGPRSKRDAYHRWMLEKIEE